MDSMLHRGGSQLSKRQHSDEEVGEKEGGGGHTVQLTEKR